MEEYTTAAMRLELRWMDVEELVSGPVTQPGGRRLAGIIHPLGNADLPPEEQKALRRRIVEQALQAVRTEVAKPTAFRRE